jgi:hypothetical protein
MRIERGAVRRHRAARASLPRFAPRRPPQHARELPEDRRSAKARPDVGKQHLARQRSGHRRRCIASRQRQARASLWPADPSCSTTRASGVPQCSGPLRGPSLSRSRQVTKSNTALMKPPHSFGAPVSPGSLGRFRRRAPSSLHVGFGGAEPDAVSRVPMCGIALKGPRPGFARRLELG